MDIPSQPDWLSDLEKEVRQKRSGGFPEVEIIEQVMEHSELLKDYFFPQLLRRDEFTFSSKAKKIVNHLLETNKSFVELLTMAVEAGAPAELLTKSLSWAYFEELVTAFLRNSDWNAKRTFRFKSPYKRRSNLEIDILAWNPVNQIVLVIDCKRYKTPSQAPIVKAVESQVERTFQLVEKIPDIYDEQGLNWVSSGKEYKIYPLIVTWRDHQISEHLVEGGVVRICPINKFPDFLRNIRMNLENCFSTRWSLF